MPVFDATTKLSESVWKSPDGQREIFKVTLEIEGQPMVAKTYSKDISAIGWSGSVESYEKPGRNGSETFVKQPAKEFTPQHGGSPAPTAASKPAGRPAFDNYTMYLSYAKDIAVAMIEKGKLDEAAYGEVLSAVANGGDMLYESRPDAPKKQQELDVVAEVTPEELNKLFPEE